MQVFEDRGQLGDKWREIRAGRQSVVFTNGCFDILHAGHVSYLEEARRLGDFLVLGLNSDDSIKRLKGPKRPIVPFADRAAVLAGLRSVDMVIGFNEDTPYQLIQQIQPNILVKGGDWKPEQIVGSDIVQKAGGTVRSLSFKPGSSTTDIISVVLERYT